MTARIDITGQRFTRLTVKEFIGGGKWLCVCDCGTEKAFYTQNLKRELSKSCGCLNVELVKARGAAHVSTFDPVAYAKQYAIDNADQIKEQRATYRAENGDAIKASQKVCYETKKDVYKARVQANYDGNPEPKRAYQRRYETVHREQRMPYLKAWHERNPGFRAQREADYRARKLRATPAWADRKAMAAIYNDARRLSLETGIEHEVDHIVPLRGVDVCGLHWEENLQIITAAANRAKSNHFIGLFY
jgi:5-methylcytosine-specific restriction endonuclease McrA